MPEDGGHLVDTSDMEGGPFHMTFILDNKIDNFSEIASFINGSIHNSTL